MKSLFQRLMEDGKIIPADFKMFNHEFDLPQEIGGWIIIGAAEDSTILIKDNIIIEMSLN